MMDSTGMTPAAPETTDSSGNLQWVSIKSDNFLIKNLKQMVGHLAHEIRKEAEQTEKDLKKAKKVFNG